MNFINNWMQPVTLPAGVTALALDLADGRYRLTLADSATAPTRWEIVEAVLDGDEAVLTRGREGTLDQDWPVGSVIYAGITAGMLDQLYQRIASLEARVTALEPPAAGVVVDVGAVEGVAWFGFYTAALGAVAPGAIDIPGTGPTEIEAMLFDFDGSSPRFSVRLSGDVTAAGLPSLEVEGYGQLSAAEGTVTYYGEANQTEWFWYVDAESSPWQAGQQRRVTPAFN